MGLALESGLGWVRVRVGSRVSRVRCLGDVGEGGGQENGKEGGVQQAGGSRAVEI